MSNYDYSPTVVESRFFLWRNNIFKI